jgi:hypothetical protein
MGDYDNTGLVHSKRVPWNKCKLTGAKPPLRPKHVWAIRTKLQVCKRDLAIFNLAVDSKLRSCDVVSIRVEEIAPRGYAESVRQKKTGHPVKVELTEPTRQALDDYLKATGRQPGQFLFAGRKSDGGLTTRQYARLLSEWLAGIGLDPLQFGTSLPQADESDVDLQEDWQSTRGSTAPGAHENRKHRQVFGHQGRRCPRDSGTS